MTVYFPIITGKNNYMYANCNDYSLICHEMNEKETLHVLCDSVLASSAAFWNMTLSQSEQKQKQ